MTKCCGTCRHSQKAREINNMILCKKDMKHTTSDDLCEEYKKKKKRGKKK